MPKHYVLYGAEVTNGDAGRYLFVWAESDSDACERFHDLISGLGADPWFSAGPPWLDAVYENCCQFALQRADRKKTSYWRVLDSGNLI